MGQIPPRAYRDQGKTLSHTYVGQGGTAWDKIGLAELSCLLSGPDRLEKVCGTKFDTPRGYRPQRPSQAPSGPSPGARQRPLSPHRPPEPPHACPVGPRGALAGREVGGTARGPARGARVIVDPVGQL